jgi:glutamate-5-semialdehyde dehydrogenase
MDDMASYVEGLGLAARRASRQLARLDGAAKIAALQGIAAALRAGAPALLSANAADLAAAQNAGLAPALIERLRLTNQRIAAMADSVAQIAQQPDPVGQIIEGYVRPSGLRITKMRVPIGVI